MNKKYFAAAALACALMSCGTGKNSVAVVDFTGEWNIVEVNGVRKMHHSWVLTRTDIACMAMLDAIA